MFRSEKELQDTLMKDDYLDFDGMEMYNLISEFKVGNGFIDILGVNHADQFFGVIELKLDNIGSSAITQIMSYVADFKEMISTSERYHDYDVFGYLVGRSYSQAGAIKYLQPEITYVGYTTLAKCDPAYFATTQEYKDIFLKQSKSLDKLDNGYDDEEFEEKRMAVAKNAG